ncbi:MAG: tRNA uridine-5-carboxymethylaminomethyl(34) synthesis GTPase MnmE [Nitrospirae bacterium]|nr:tRNA uridine-5-carboxymethylaminomethyl(34) synthesis GTPase MnmE [Nitrospirota bacterium]
MDDTIAAISTPLGEGGIGIIRLSGKEAVSIANRMFVTPTGKTAARLASHSITYGYIKDGQDILDEVLLSVMLAPNSFTKEDVVEINCHGGLIPLRRVLDAAIKNGARLASPGEFTLRAFLNGRIDLTQAEAVCDIIQARTQESAAVALQQLSGGLSQRLSAISQELIGICAHVEAYIDFPEEDIELSTHDDILNQLQTLQDTLKTLSGTYDRGRFLREGLSIAIAGKPNVGKSSLLNSLMERDRAIVTPTPGTTRDTIEEYINVKGIPVRIIDTAGIRTADDLAEREGVNRSIMAIEAANIVLIVFDGTQHSLTHEDTSVINRTTNKTVIAIINKADQKVLLSDKDVKDALLHPLKERVYAGTVTLSAKTGQGIEDLKQAIFDLTMKVGFEPKEGILITNLRHKTAIDNTVSALTQAINCLKDSAPLEITALELTTALNYLGEITGTVTANDILNKIFEDFCIGK